ncbi:HEAT repeat domain-containing protein [Oscillochloris sp. ZM17-4]|uniref:HEAT repeat domain-containing protein n=1 Tax=Oscillochloris sp. ZM17-4 TaxID=2866714 RepID=UPI001C737626|nr:HEAT repeat domain-containing protein [Oscillochloris sp. ZM17-4]MBX0327737.1 HEAT repeat domain-containing protein [Oscillochloris sp. ZM17-4]
MELDPITSDETDEQIRQYIDELDDSSSTARDVICMKLTRLGRRSSPALIAALSDPRDRVRLEAARCLRVMRDPDAAPALVRALEDDMGDVRWVAAESLCALGSMSLIPLLRALQSERWDETNLRLGAHHVLRTLISGGLAPIITPVMQALDGVGANLTVPLAAHKALEDLRAYDLR